MHKWVYCIKHLWIKHHFHALSWREQSEHGHVILSSDVCNAIMWGNYAKSFWWQTLALAFLNDLNNIWYLRWTDWLVQLSSHTIISRSKITIGIYVLNVFPLQCMSSYWIKKLQDLIERICFNANLKNLCTSCHFYSAFFMWYYKKIKK